MNSKNKLLPDNNELNIPELESIQQDRSHNKHDVSIRQRAIELFMSFLVTMVPPMAFFLAIYLHITGWYSISWIEISLMITFQVIGLIGVELGCHRLFSHNSFKAKRPTKIALAIMGSIGFQGPIIWWASVHRRHHRYTDRAQDPHSIYIKSNGEEIYNKGFWSLLRGFYHAHMGWVWNKNSIGTDLINCHTKDLYRDADLLNIHRNYLYWLSLGFTIPAILGGLLHGTWQGVFLGFLWGGFVRVFVQNHLTYWTTNSLSHSIGKRPFKTADNSSNSIPLIFAIPTLGQSYHNNHHAFPFSARMSHSRFEFDIGYQILRGLEKIGQVSDIMTPKAEMINNKRQ